MRTVTLALLLVACSGDRVAQPTTGAAGRSDAGGGSSGEGGAAGSTATGGAGGGGTGGSGGSAPFVCPQDGVRSPGSHRLFIQGQGGEHDVNGVYPLLHEWEHDGSDAKHCDDAYFVDDTSMDGVWQPGEEPNPLGPSALTHGEHFLVGQGAYVEFETTLCDDIDGEVAFYIPNFDVAGSRALHQLFVVHGGQETLVAETVDEEAGDNGYNPFVRVLSGIDPTVIPGDILRLRSTNLSGHDYSVMVWMPPSKYESWILVHVSGDAGESG